MMSDEDDDIWYSKPKNGLIQEQRDADLDESYCRNPRMLYRLHWGHAGTAKSLRKMQIKL